MMCPSHLTQLLLGIGHPHVMVIGDFMLDEYIRGTVDRICPEVPVPIVLVRAQEARPGGAALVTTDLLNFGAKVTCLGTLGCDKDGRTLRKLLSHPQNDTTGLIALKERPTTVKQRIVALGLNYSQQLIRIDHETRDPLDGPATAQLIDSFDAAAKGIQAICLQDYNKGVLSSALCEHAITWAKRQGIPVVVDPAPIKQWSKYMRADLIKPNRRETSEFVGFSPDTTIDREKATSLIQSRLSINNVVITLDSEGSYLKEGDLPGRHYPAFGDGLHDSPGAGDMFLAALTLCIASGCDCRTAVQIANIAAGIEVQSPDSARLGIRTMVDRIDRSSKLCAKVGDAGMIAKEVQRHRQQGRTILFTNGCFDILHRGHLEYLKFCKQNGDIVVVGLNSDVSVRRIKGPGRPINNEVDRVAMLAAIEYVDYVVVFNESTPLRLIKKIVPDVLVKGEDWATLGVVGTQIVEGRGGRVLLAPLVKGMSTTSTISKLRRLPR